MPIKITEMSNEQLCYCKRYWYYNNLQTGDNLQLRKTQNTRYNAVNKLVLDIL